MSGLKQIDKTYKVIFSSLVKEEGYFKGQMLRFGVSADISEGIIKKSPVILKRGLSLKDARAYADAVIQAGGKVSIQVEASAEENYEEGRLPNVISLKKFTMCPKCGYKQLKAEKCIRCGLKWLSPY
jgi:hypothetical protein